LACASIDYLKLVELVVSCLELFWRQVAKFDSLSKKVLGIVTVLVNSNSSLEVISIDAIVKA